MTRGIKISLGKIERNIHHTVHDSTRHRCAIPRLACDRFSKPEASVMQERVKRELGFGRRKR
jgi:hypothetical protein